MDRDRLRGPVLVVLVVLAFGAMAATLDAGEPSTACPGNESPAAGAGTVTDCRPPPPDDGGDRSGTNRSGPDPGASAPTIACPAPLTDPTMLAGAFGAVGLLAAGLYVRSRAALLPAAVGAPLALGLLAACPYALLNRAPLLRDLAGVTVPPALSVVGGVLVVGGAVALLYVLTDEAAVDDVADRPAETGDLGAIGEAAGEAADRIERQADVENEVYRAWREMVAHLDVPNPEATTPDEFAEAAVDAGMRPRDVTTLTRLFEEVRYGEMDPAEREARAVDALRGIEAAYADAGGDGT